VTAVVVRFGEEHGGTDAVRNLLVERRGAEDPAFQAPRDRDGRGPQTIFREN
jgi:hypothetical protein